MTTLDLRLGWKPGAVAALALVFLAPAFAEDAPAVDGSQIPKTEKPNVLSAKAVLKKLHTELAKVPRFRAEFDQEKHLKVFKTAVKSNGVLLFERPDRMRWEIRKPFRSLLIVSGKNVAKFEWVDGKRRKLKLGRAADAVLIAMRRLQAWFSGNFDEKNFTVTVVQKPALHVLLIPRDEAMRKRVARMEFFPAADFRSMAKVVVHESKGNRTLLTFRQHESGAKMPKDAFSLTDPSAVIPAAVNPEIGKPAAKTPKRGS